MNGKPVQIFSAQLDIHPHRVVVVLDSSGSMLDGALEWDLARSIAMDTLRVPPSAFRTGLIVFNSQVRAKFPIQDDARPSLELLDELKATESRPDRMTGGRTAMWDALKEALALLEPSEFGDAIYLIADGLDSHSKTTPKEVRILFVKRGVRLFVVLFDPWSPRRMMVDTQQSDSLREIASNSGGRTTSVQSGLTANRLHASFNFDQERLKDLDAAIATIYSHIRFPLRLEIALPEDLKKPRHWELSVNTPKDSKAPWQLSYPRLLDACSLPASAPNHP